MVNSKKSQKVSESLEDNTCNWCGKSFTREKTLLVHSCIKKTRWQNKDEKWALIGYHAWKRFFEMNNVGKKEYNIRDYVNSRYYNDFAKLGWFLFNRRAINNDAYIEYVLKAGLKPKDWVKESEYQKWASDFVKAETPNAGVERSIRHMDKWASDHRSEFNLYFKEVSTALAVRHLLDGHISPWIIYLSETSDDLLNRMDNHQLSLIEPVINPVAWKIKLNNKHQEVTELKEILKRYGI